MTRELIVDAFAGGGGASVGIEWATGRSPDLAINHDPLAVAVHRANHPATFHYTEDVWAVDPWLACAQGFPETYQLAEVNGRAVPRTAQVRLIGNSVCPPLAAAVVAANWRPQDFPTLDDSHICP
jgi:site-specific DNA-cytosine methylase